MSPKLSLCIPTYNQTNFLRKTLESIIQQKFQAFEIIITDDSDTDDVRHLIESFSFDIKIQYLKNSERLDSPENWNYAMSLAQGDYIKILHHDDWLAHENALEQFVDLLDQNPQADFAFGRTIVWTNGQTRVHPVSSEELDYLSKDPLYLIQRNCIGAPSATIFRNRPDLIQFDPKIQWLVDLDFYIRLLQINPKFVFQETPLIYTANQANHQVTAKFLLNKEDELNEYFYLFEKYQLSDKLNEDYLIVFRRLFLKYDILDIKELEFIKSDIPEKLLKSLKHEIREIKMFKKYGNSIYAKIKRNIKASLMYLGLISGNHSRKSS